MKNFMCRFLLAILITIPCTTYALSVDGYLVMRSDADSYTDSAKTAQFSINAYLSGMSDTLNSLRQADGSLLRNSDPYICAPKAVEINPNLLRSVIDSEIKNNSELYNKFLGNDWKKYTVSAIAQHGLSWMFPCQ